MTRCLRTALLVAIASGWIASPLAAAVESEDLAGLRWRLLGPFRGGWATCTAGVPGEPAAEVNADLASLATDLESADARPTAAQRQLLAEAKMRLEAAQARWLGPLGEALRKTPRG